MATICYNIVVRGRNFRVEQTISSEVLATVQVVSEKATSLTTCLPNATVLTAVKLANGQYHNAP